MGEWKPIVDLEGRPACSVIGAPNPGMPLVPFSPFSLPIPVAMEMPCPYKHGDIRILDIDRGNSPDMGVSSFVGPDGLSGWVRVTDTATWTDPDSHPFVWVDFFQGFVDDGIHRTMTFTVSTDTGPYWPAYFRAQLYVSSWLVGDLMLGTTYDGPPTGTLPVPYYRYTLGHPEHQGVTLMGFCQQGGSVQLDWTLS